MSLVNRYDNPLNPWQYETSISRSTPFPRSLIAETVLEEYTFPLSVEIGIDYPIRLLVHNIGTDGLIGGAVSNVLGNPGSFTYIGLTEEFVVMPGSYRGHSSPSPVAYCTNLDINRSIRFNALGTYQIQLLTLHEDAGTWYYDQIVPLVVTVGQAGTVTQPYHVMDRVTLKAESWEIVKSKTRPIISIDTKVLVGGKLDYTISYTRGNEPITTARLFWNDINYVDVNLTIGQNNTGSIDITGSINTANDLMIQIESAPLFWAELSFDVWLTLEFSEDPEVDPDLPFNWEEFIAKYGKWIALGTLGVVVLYMMRKPGQPIIVLGGKK